MASLLNGATRIFNQKTLIILYLVGTIAFGYSGYRLQHKAFTQPPSSGQVFVAIFVQHPNARLDLIAHINPNQPSQDQLAVRIRSGNPGQWLVIIQCPSESAFVFSPEQRDTNFCGCPADSNRVPAKRH